MIPRLLLVDDHELFRAGIARILEDTCDICGYASDGQEAIEKVIELRPDLVLLDISVPVMGGRAAAREIRRVAPATKIVLLSMSESEAADQSTDVDACLSKRSPIGALYKAIARILNLPYEDPIEPNNVKLISIDGRKAE